MKWSEKIWYLVESLLLSLSWSGVKGKEICDWDTNFKCWWKNRTTWIMLDLPSPDPVMISVMAQIE